GRPKVAPYPILACGLAVHYSYRHIYHTCSYLELDITLYHTAWTPLPDNIQGFSPSFFFTSSYLSSTFPTSSQSYPQKMSTALVSSFYDVNNVIYKNNNKAQYQNSYDHKGKHDNRRQSSSSSAVNHHHNNQHPRRNSSGLISKSHHSSMINVASANTMNHNGHSNSNKNHHNHLDRGSENEDERKRVINSSRYKTELCRPFEESGTCKYGDKCQFAHGIHELRALARHPKYKTELCRTYHTIGFCPYGPRCHFIHNEDEKRQPSIGNNSSSSNNAPLNTNTATNGNLINKNGRGQQQHHHHHHHHHHHQGYQQSIPLPDDHKEGVQMTMSRSADSFKLLLEKDVSVQEARHAKYMVNNNHNNNLAYSNNDNCSNSSSSNSSQTGSTGSNGRIENNFRNHYGNNKKMQSANNNNTTAYSVIGGHRRKNLSYPTTDSGNYSPVASPIAIQPPAVVESSNTLSSPSPPVQQFRSLSLGQPENFNHSESPVIYNDIVSLIGPESNASDDVFENNNQHSSYDNSTDQLSNNDSGKISDNEDSASSNSSVCSGMDDLNLRRLPVFDSFLN
ncbi:Zinc finger protein 36, C3H1 type-like 1, partial [Trichoplax sp. H2]